MAKPLENTPGNSGGYAYAIISLVLLILTWLAVFARLAARLSIKSLGLDDGFIVLAQLAMTTFAIGAFGSRSVDNQKYIMSLSLQQKSIYWLMVNESSFALGMAFLKISLGAFFLRLIHLPLQRKVIYTAMIISTIVNVYIALISIFVCGIPSSSYIFRYLENECIPRSALKASAFLQGGVNTATDITYAVTPFFLLRKSQLPKAVQLYVGGILVLATVGCIASIVRFWYIESLFAFSPDLFSQLAILGIVGGVELATGIIASSVTTLRPLCRSCMGYTSTIVNRTGRSSRKATEKSNSKGSGEHTAGATDSSKSGSQDQTSQRPTTASLGKFAFERRSLDDAERLSIVEDPEDKHLGRAADAELWAPP